MSALGAVRLLQVKNAFAACTGGMFTTGKVLGMSTGKESFMRAAKVYMC